MGSHFGGAAPYKSHIAHMRWLCSGLFAVIIVVSGSLVGVITGYLPGGTQGVFEPQQISSTNCPPAVPILPVVNVLAARDSIEAGTKLRGRLFEIKAVPEEFVPQGVVLASEQDILRKTYAKTFIPARGFILKDAVSTQRPITAFHIPKGYRASTITIDARSGVEGFAKPNTRVDVLWLYHDDDGVQKIATVVRQALILSVGGRTDAEAAGPTSGGATTATLLVPERDAKVIELARDTGRVSLSLVGEEEVGLPGPDDIVTVHDLTRSKEEPQTKAEIRGMFATIDPRTGKRVHLALGSNGWEVTQDANEADPQTLNSSPGLDKTASGIRPDTRAQLSEKRPGLLRAVTLER